MPTKKNQYAKHNNSVNFVIHNISAKNKDLRIK